MPVNYTYPGTGTGGDHPYATRLDHSLSEPFTLANPLDAAQGPGAYSDNMWYKLETLKDPIIQMTLLERWRAQSVWRAFNYVQVAMRHANGALAERMTWKGVFDMEPTTDPVGTRQIWFPNNYTDTWEKEITFKTYADKVALHEYDDAVQAYLYNGRAGLRNIARTLLGRSATVFQDILIRNAYLNHPYPRYMGGATSFSGIDDTATYWFDPSVARDIWMDLSYNGVPLAVNPTGNGTSGMMICITTPSVIKNIQDQVGNEWYTLYLQSNPSALLRYEVGSYKNVRFIASPRNVLWNCGDIITRATLNNAYGPGDGGSPDKVDNVYTVGQSSGVNHWIENTITVGTSFQVGDIVTIHRTVTSDFGVTDGVDYREGTARRRRIVAIGDGTTGPLGALTFDRPLFHDFPAGSYITKAYDIHPSVFLAGPGGVVTGVGDPIMAYPMPPIDDARAIWRFVWKGRFDTQLFMPEVFEVVFSGGTRPSRGIAQGL